MRRFLALAILLLTTTFAFAGPSHNVRLKAHAIHGGIAWDAANATSVSITSTKGPVNALATHENLSSEGELALPVGSYAVEAFGSLGRTVMVFVDVEGNDDTLTVSEIQAYLTRAVNKTDTAQQRVYHGITIYLSAPSTSMPTVNYAVWNGFLIWTAHHAYDCGVTDTADTYSSGELPTTGVLALPSGGYILYANGDRHWQARVYFLIP